MRIIMIARAITFAICGATAIAATSANAQEQPPAIRIQANPPGEGVPSTTPPDPATADAPVPPAMPADAGYQAGPYKGALTPPPVQALGKAYPLCTRSLQDSCVNPGETGAGEVRAPRRALHPHRN